MSCLYEKTRGISVIIPLYHGKKYIENLYKMCVNALEKAGMLQESEIIFVNDSPDEQIVLSNVKYAKLIENEKNIGIHGSKCNGLKCAKGEYIHFLDQDDEISSNFYMSQIGHLKGTDIVICNAIMEHPGYERKLYRSKFALRMITNPMSYIYIDNRVESLGQCLIRKASIPFGWTDSKMEVNGADDYYLLLSLFAEKKKFTVNPDFLYRHVYTENNLSLDNSNMNKSVQNVAELMEIYYPSNPLTKALQKKVDYLSGIRSISVVKFVLPKVVRNISRKIRG